MQIPSPGSAAAGGTPPRGEKSGGKPSIHFWPGISNGSCFFQHIKLAGDATSKIHGQIAEICDGETCTMRAVCVCVCVFFHAVTFDGSVFYLKHKREWRSRTHIWGPRKWWVFSSLPRHRTCSPAGKHGRCILVVVPWVFPWVSIQISKAVLWDTAGTGQGQILAARIVHLAEKNPKGRYRKYPGNLENVIGKHHRTIILETRLRSFLGLQTE